MLTVRQANNNDAKAIQQLIFNIWLNEYGFDVKPSDFPDLVDIEKYYTRKDGVFFVALEQTEVVGTIALDRLSSDVYVLKRMFVKKAYRRQGVAQQLLDHLLAFIPRSSEARLFLSTKQDQALAAKAFYLKNAFEVVDRTRLPAGFPFFYEDDLFMLKKISV